MFSIFNKKEQPKPDNKVVCVGVKYSKDSDITQEELDSCFEVFKKFSVKVYSPEDIIKINENFGFDTNDYYEWKDLSLIESGTKKNLGGIYRYAGSKSISEEHIEKLFEDSINPDKYYSRSDIQSLAAEIGVDIMARNNFNYYSVAEITYSDGSVATVIEEMKD